MKKLLKASLTVTLLGYVLLLLNYHWYVKPFRKEAFRSVAGFGSRHYITMPKRRG